MATTLLSGSLVLSGCVSSTIDTSQSFSAPGQVTASDVLALTNDDALPRPELRPGDASAFAATTPATTVAATGADPAALSASEQTVAFAAPGQPVADAASLSQDNTVIAAATPTATPAGDDASARIAAAANAPVATAPASTTPVPQPEVAVAAAPPVAPAPQVQAQPQRTGLLSALFGNRAPRPAAAVPQATAARAEAPAARPQVVATARSAPEPVRPVIATASARGSSSGLPGVDRERALGIAETEDADDAEGGEIRVASAAGLARLAPNGLRTQHDGVDVKCFKPALVRVLKTVERKYGRPAVVTSGYRSPTRNARARGAKNSLHMYCAAADIQVDGVSKWDLAKYLRSLPGRGGVGTYCHTNSVHIDIGPKRDWNWRCRRKS